MSAIKQKPSPPDWRGAEKYMWKENARLVPEQVAEQDSGMMKRIKTYCDRFGYALQKVMDKIMGDDMFAAHFSKDPSKQSIHESMAAKYLEKLSEHFESLPAKSVEIRDFGVLPKGGMSAFYITSNGDIKAGIGKNKDASTSKSLDFLWQTNGITCYASHKYTHEAGGAQDHQFRDQKRFLENFQNNKDIATALFVICDGKYYTEDKMEELRKKQRTESPLSFAIHIEEIEDKLKILARINK